MKSTGRALARAPALLARLRTEGDRTCRGGRAAAFDPQGCLSLGHTQQKPTWAPQTAGVPTVPMVPTALTVPTVPTVPTAAPSHQAEARNHPTPRAEAGRPLAAPPGAAAWGNEPHELQPTSKHRSGEEARPSCSLTELADRTFWNSKARASPQPESQAAATPGQQ